MSMFYNHYHVHYHVNRGVKKVTTSFGGGHSFHLHNSVGAPQGIPMGIPFCCSFLLGRDSLPLLLVQFCDLLTRVQFKYTRLLSPQTESLDSTYFNALPQKKVTVKIALYHSFISFYIIVHCMVICCLIFSSSYCILLSYSILYLSRSIRFSSCILFVYLRFVYLTC